MRLLLVLWVFVGMLTAAAASSPFAADPNQPLERTCFQTGQGWSPPGNLRSDVAIVYGIDPKLPDRIQTWRDHGYRIHVMTGVSWGSYQDYLYGRFDGINHEDEAQTERNGTKISHGGDVYYMCPGTNFGKFLCVGVQRALDAGAEAIHLEEPEFWVRGGYSEGFKREWRSYYDEDWQPPHTSVDGQWRASKLKYFLYRRALQQVFAYVQGYNRRTGRKVRCYVPTHSLLNYAHWRIVSPESSLARLDGCDGYIAQVWTGTSRTPNLYRGELRERTFETAFLEYGAMQNLVRSTGRRVWYLNDPVEDDPNHDWEDYRVNWESTLVASLLQPQVWNYEVAPWPERVFAGKYPRRAGAGQRQGIPPAYATELQTVMNALNDLNQSRTEWDCGSRGLGVLVSDSLMFQRGEPSPSDAHLGQVYGLALPLLKRGIPVAPVQLENLGIRDYLAGFKVLLLTYHGQKPLSPDVHPPLADWVKRGGALVVVDDDSDPYNTVREWWNSGGRRYATPRAELFEQLGLDDQRFTTATGQVKAGKGVVIWLRQNPARLAAKPEGDQPVVTAAKAAAAARGLKWKEANYLSLRRGPYVIAAGLDESLPAESKVLPGAYVNLFDPALRVQESVTLKPRARFFLLDLASVRRGPPCVLAAACKTLAVESQDRQLSLMVEGVANTPAVVLLRVPGKPKSATLDGHPLDTLESSAEHKLLWVRFQNESSPRVLSVSF
ncbi:MAG TPA: hypothetical protein VJA21_25870 [Verrucomicrobiae bacterium]